MADKLEIWHRKTMKQMWETLSKNLKKKTDKVKERLDEPLEKHKVTKYSNKNKNKKRYMQQKFSFFLRKQIVIFI